MWAKNKKDKKKSNCIGFFFHIILFSLFFFIYISSIYTQSYIQVRPHKNIEIHQEDFNDKKLHFGFFIGGNMNYYYIAERFPFQYQGQNLERTNQKIGWGLTVGLLGEWHILSWLSLRFVPDFSLEKRSLIFQFSAEEITQTINRSVFNLPLLFRVQSMRLGNFAFHVSAGGGVSVDITGKKGLTDYIFTQQAPFFVSFAIGTDFFLQFFKMGFELRCDIGVGNQLEKQAVPLESALEKLRTGALRLLISFEG